jgi:acetylornithine deacetylase/succinyl-diaminopimelate desuccinylase-like protein
MNEQLEKSLAALESSRQDDLMQWLRIPSISADPAYQPDIARAAAWVREKLASLGLQTELIPTRGNPLVYAQTPKVAGATTVLVYGHYDVQPADPLDLWHSPPFEPTVRDGNIVARGATDDKGQLLTHVQSLAAWLATGQPLPIQIKYLIEGEEEVGSGGLEHWLPNQAEKLSCDVVVISDNSQFSDGQPAITYGLRGIVAFELHIEGPNTDLHSGTFGGAVCNPAIALSKIMASMHDHEGRVTVAGFYDAVRPLSEQEREQLAELAMDESQLCKQLGVDRLVGESGYSVLERRWTRPTLDINGLTSGYQGVGGKTIIPSKASAKFTMRLVPDQDPTAIIAAVEKHVAAVCPAGVRWRLERGHGAPGMLARLDSPYITAAARAIERSFGKQPVLIREGGSIPIVAKFQELLHADCLLLGWGLDDDRAHAPNEKFRLADYHRGTRASAFLWDELGKVC